MLVKKSQKIPFFFECKKCDYKTSSKKDYKKHTDTMKHNMLVNASNIPIKPSKTFICSCGKSYFHESSYYRHSKTHNSHPIEDINTDAINKDLLNDKDIIQHLLKENAEFKEFMLEQNKQMIKLANNVGNNNNNVNTTNNQFNLNVYLHETCKNAMNIMDFVNQLQVGVHDLEETGRLGYAEGISKIFINGLNKINVSDRPIHCSDQKRETFYIKNNNEWNKETQHKLILTNAIKHVANKNIKQITEWTKIHPDYRDSSTKDNDRYLKIVCESMSGTNEEESNQNYSKIIKNIAKGTVINKPESLHIVS